MVEDGYGRNSMFDRPPSGHPEAWISQNPGEKQRYIAYALTQNGYLIA